MTKIKTENYLRRTASLQDLGSLAKYADRDPYANRIGITYECMVLGEDRIDMCVSKNIDLVEFENMAQTFYGAMSQYYR